MPMRLSRFELSSGLSAVSWSFIEAFTLSALFLLPFSKSAAEICVAVALVLWLLRKFPWDEKFPRIPYCGAAYAVFFIIALLSLQNVPAGDMTTGLRGLGKILKHFGIFFMCAELFSDPKRLRRFWPVFIACMTLVCVDGFYQMYHGHDFIKNYTADIPGRFIRMQGPLQSPNDLATFLLLALPIVFFLWINEKKWSFKSAVLAGILILFGVSFLATLSRSAFLALYFSVAFYALLSRKLKLFWLAALAPAVLLLSPMLRYNFFTSLSLKDITVGERLHYWDIALRMIQRHPLAGNGVNMFAHQYASFSAAAEQYKGYAHNCYVQMAAEVGIPGLLVFLFPFLAILPKMALGDAFASKRNWLKTALLIGIAAYLLQSAFDTNFYALQAAMIFWICWGTLCGAFVEKKNKRSHFA